MQSLLYTKTGDNGTTSLVGGQRVAKNSARLEAYGTLDELSSYLGAVASDADCTAEVRGQLHEVQNEMFNIGSYLATAVEPGTQPTCASLTDAKLAELEGWIDALDEQTPKIRAFVLPGGTKLSAETHIARTVCRRSERRLIDLADKEYVDPRVTAYVNRLSDYLFIVARFFNFIKGVEEVVWKK